MDRVEKTASCRRSPLLFSIVVGAVFVPIFPTPTADACPPPPVSPKPALQIKHSRAHAKTSGRLRPTTVQMTVHKMVTDAGLPLPDLQLILPAQPSCWSHAQSVNPQGSQDNGDFDGTPNDDLVAPNATSEPLLNRFRPASDMPSFVHETGFGRCLVYPNCAENPVHEVGDAERGERSSP